LKLKQDWETLPPIWSVRDQTLPTRATPFTFFIPQREEATADGEGDGIHLFDFDPTDGQSAAVVITRELQTKENQGNPMSYCCVLRAVSA